MKALILSLVILSFSPLISAQNNFSIEVKGVKTLTDLSKDMSYWNDGVGGEIRANYSITPVIRTNLSFSYSQFQYSGKRLDRLIIPEYYTKSSGEKTEMINLTIGASLNAKNTFISPIFAIAFGAYSISKGLVLMDVYDMQNVFVYKIYEEATGKTESGFMMNLSLGVALQLIENLRLNVMAGYQDFFTYGNIFIPISAGVEFIIPAF